MFLNGNKAAEKEITANNASRKFLKDAMAFDLHQFNIGQMAHISVEGQLEEVELDYGLENLSTFIIIANKQRRVDI